MRVGDLVGAGVPVVVPPHFRQVDDGGAITDLDRVDSVERPVREGEVGKGKVSADGDDTRHSADWPAWQYDPSAGGGQCHRVVVDMLERLEEELEKGAAAGTAADELLTKLVSLLGSDRETLDRVLAALGWQKVTVEGETPLIVLRRKALPPRKHRPHRPQKPSAPRADSPFAELAVLVGK